MTEMNRPSKETTGIDEQDAARKDPGTDDDAAVTVVYATFPNMETARATALRLVGGRLAACVNVIPGMTSIYVWEGAVQEDLEVSVLLKTTRACREACIAAIVDGHPYAIPAAVAWEASGGSQAYLTWVIESTKPA